MYRLWIKLEDKIPRMAVVLVVGFPLVEWSIRSIEKRHVIYENPYGLPEASLILITCLLMIIHSKISEVHSVTNPGDETKIIMNRNESDYYEIWTEVRSFRNVSIDALGHTFNTLWFNFIKKFLQEVIAHAADFDVVSVKLISTVPSPTAFGDIVAFYKSLDQRSAKKITIHLIKVPPSTSFFTGLCVNKNVLWLSIREPHRVIKANEHVREWRRQTSASAEKMVNWYVGIVDYLDSIAVKRLTLSAN